jgi:hypothetical protein
MIVCMKCGRHNADNVQWCVACDAFLEWDGEMVAPAPPTPVAEVPLDEPKPKRGLIKRIKSAVGIDSGEQRRG